LLLPEPSLMRMMNPSDSFALLEFILRGPYIV
jgi:hypothetical protein